MFTSGGVGPTHDDVTIEGVARALGVAVVRDPRLVRAAREASHKGRLNEARLKMAEVPEGAELVAGEELIFPAVVVRNVYVLPGVPEIFRQKFEALKERFRESPFHLCSVFVSMPEGTLADHLNELLARHPDLMLGLLPGVLQRRVQGQGDARVEGPRLRGAGRRRPAHAPAAGSAVVRVER